MNKDGAEVGQIDADRQDIFLSVFIGLQHAESHGGARRAGDVGL